MRKDRQHFMRGVLQYSTSIEVSQYGYLICGSTQIRRFHSEVFSFNIPFCHVFDNNRHNDRDRVNRPNQWIMMKINGKRNNG